MFSLKTKTFFLDLTLILVLVAVSLHAFFLPLNKCPYTHDGKNHLARFANYKLALKEGQLPPRFAPNLLNHYGYPVFNYNYPLANILSLPFSILGLNYELTFKIMVFFSLVFGAFGVLVLLKDLLKKDLSFLSKVVVLITYLASPYLVNLVYFRGNIGEILVYGLLPWLFWVLAQSKFKPAKKTAWRWLFSITIFSSFLLAHNVSVMVGIFILGSWAFFNWLKTPRQFFFSLKEFLLWLLLPSLGLTLWFWLPALAELKEVVVSQAGIQNEYLLHLVSFTEMFYSPLKLGFSYPGHVNSLSFWVGWGSLLALFFYLVTLLLKLIKKGDLKLTRWFWFLGTLSLVLIFAMHWWAQPVWRFFSFLRFIQFPWRLTPWLVLSSLTLTAYFLSLKQTFWFKLSFLVVVLAQLLVVLNASPFEYFHLKKIDYELFPESTSTQNENRSVSFSYTNIGNWQPSPTVVDGQAEIKVKYWTGSKRSYTAVVKKTALVIEPTMRFLGWQTKIRPIDQKNYQDVNYVDDDRVQGRIAYRLPPGEWEVVSVFTQKTWSRAVGNLAFLVTLVTIVGISLKLKKDEAKAS